MSTNAIVVICVLVLVLGIVTLSGLPILRAHFRGQRLATQGETATARVLALRDTGTRVNGQVLTDVEVEVQPPGGAAFRSSAQAIITPINGPAMQPGRTLNVRYDPNDHRRVVIMGAVP